MKAFIKTVFASTIILASTQSFAATETLNVAVVFDSSTTSYSYAQQFTIAKQQVTYLNNTMENSNMSNHIRYQLVVYKSIKFSNYFDNYDDLVDEYQLAAVKNSDTGIPSLPLNHVSKDSYADVVIGIVDPWNESNVCGTTPILPRKSIQGDFSVNELLEFADTGIVFITDKSSCLNDPITASHEVGHSFGLWHGADVQSYTGESGHFSHSDSIDTQANGYGHIYGSKYGTIMTGYNLDITNPDNKYSDKYQHDCGPYSKSCGDSVSNAVSVLEQYKSLYNKRGNWYN